MDLLIHPDISWLRIQLNRKKKFIFDMDSGIIGKIILFEILFLMMPVHQ